MTNVVLSLVLLAAFALCLCAVIAVGNVLIWTVPIADGTTPLESLGEAEGE